MMEDKFYYQTITPIMDKMTLLPPSSSSSSPSSPPPSSLPPSPPRTKLTLTLTLTNNTIYNTKDIRAVIKKVMEYKGVQELDVTVTQYTPKRNPLTYECREGKKGKPLTKLESLNTDLIDGSADDENKPEIQISLPLKKFVEENGKIIKEQITILNGGLITELTQGIMHEIDHVLGLDHKDMQDWWNLPAGYTEGMIIRRKQ